MIVLWAMVNPALAYFGGLGAAALTATLMNQGSRFLRSRRADIAVVSGYSEYLGRDRHMARIEVVSAAGGEFRAWLIGASAPRKSGAGVPLGWANEKDATVILPPGVLQGLNLGEMERREQATSWTLTPIGPGFPESTKHLGAGPCEGDEEFSVRVVDMGSNRSQVIVATVGYEGSDPIVRPRVLP